MAKPIPQVKAKKNGGRKKEIEKLTSKKSQKQIEKLIAEHLSTMRIVANARMEYADTIIAANDAPVQEVIDSMVESLKAMQGTPKLYLDGQALNVSQEEFQTLLDIQEKTFLWIAVRCLVACAEWDIRIADFKAPANACLRCGKKLKKK